VEPVGWGIESIKFPEKQAAVRNRTIWGMMFLEHFLAVDEGTHKIIMADQELKLARGGRMHVGQEFRVGTTLVS